ncbi:RAMP superfamily CRISPR-associated protein [Leptolyngbya sp. FACHB-711]|uniref:RAMP superfamily CRISPR-associated protein n=1 Tax=Leptolyngbya sp. FACHB-711 TaxID=2692813 RepID=UPI00168888C7|nr:RAMP superfamily CRISPR-associated protein [Leptolyngbya sp. FACHB-711]MBD2028258.1 hypothetical protein [Leptolyngbya sp. FACHB-711]
MVRKIAGRIQVKGTLVAQSPIHVGGIASDPDVDMSLAIDGQGRFYIPGTSLAGALRNWLKENELEDETIWGPRLTKGDDDRGHASFIILDDGVVSGRVFEVRDGVGIDRVFGSAADGIKYNRAVLPKESKIDFGMMLDLQKAGQDGENWLGTLIQALEKGEVRLGASKTRGLGRVKLENASVSRYGLNNREAMLRTLRGQGQALTLQPQQIRATSRLSVEILWQPLGSLMVKAEADGIAVDMLPLVSTVGDQVALVLPGSSIKGALRSQAERILCTVLSLPVKDEDKSKQRFQQQLEDPRLRMTQLIFGIAAKDYIGNRSENSSENLSTPQLGLGALAIDDCYCEKKIQPDQWQAIAAAKDSKELMELLKATPLKDTQQAFHVAVDRWTSGAAEGFLYSNLEPFGLKWDAISLTLNLNRIPLNEQAPAIALLLITLRDLAAGRIPLGYGVNRGMGAIQVTQVNLQGKGFEGGLAALNSEISLFQGNLMELDGKLLTELNNAWANWLQNPSEGEAQ